ncbi:adenosine deaminase [Palleronia sediminis]|uniref:Adenosine deaminase n=1 Tax=Palleronia sediminis TaxID=2547833 RepID=A0A4R6A251_9RHOB|nr:adenosine deaminase [Palleronia sediminis]TDL75086.1 adenosine deaminase [Palleronia sediminis]
MKDQPKIELHLHLEGAAPPAFMKGLAARKGRDISHLFDAAGRYNYSGFVDFLRVYEQACELLETPEDFGALMFEVLTRSAEHGVIYTELFLSPDFCGGRDLSAWRDYLAAMEDAAARAEAAHGIKARGIVTCIRHFGPEAARETARCAAETAGGFITGFGMGGDESAGRTRDFAWAFDHAREAGLGLTTHAGEWGGPGNVAAALDWLRVSRIGHGVRAIEDPALIERLVDEGIVLEVCPGSNIALGLFRTLDEHPIGRLHAAGVKLCVSTDDPPFFGTTMTREHQSLARALDWDDAVFAGIAEVAARAAFCDEDTRRELLERIAR